MKIMAIFILNNEDNVIICYNCIKMKGWSYEWEEEVTK